MPLPISNDLGRVLQAAGTAAMQFGHDAIEASDLLLAIYQDREAPAGILLREAVQERDLRYAQLTVWGQMPNANATGGATERVGPTAVPVLSCAADYAISFGALEVTSNHLAFALMQDTKIQQTLTAAHLTPQQSDTILTELTNLMSQPQVPPVLDYPPAGRPRATMTPEEDFAEDLRQRGLPAENFPPQNTNPPQNYNPPADNTPPARGGRSFRDFFGFNPRPNGQPQGGPGPANGTGPGAQPCPPGQACPVPAGPPAVSALTKFGRDLTKLAREGKLRPVIGREEEIRRCVQVLGRESKNNPVLIGEPGVGKTSIAEGVAMRIASGKVPPNLKNKRIIQIEMNDMVAGTSMRGSFEERIKEIISEAKKMLAAFVPQTGVEQRAEGLWEVKGDTQLTAFNKALSTNIGTTRGNTISAAVMEALENRASVGAITELGGCRFKVLDFRGANIIRLEVRRLDVILFIDELHTVIGSGSIGEGGMDGANALKPALARGELTVMGATTLDEYKKHFRKDGAFRRRFQVVMVNPPSVNETVQIMKGLRAKFERHYQDNVKITDAALLAAAELSDRYIQDRFLPDKAIDLVDEAASAASILLSEMDTPPEEYSVDKEQIEDILSKWTGIPVGNMREGESKKLLKMVDKLHERVIGQDPAVRAVAEAVKRARAGLKDPSKPIGSFLFLGPTGVGKTELARALQQFLFDNDEFIRLDMSEYQERHTVARLIGAPPGYVGYDDGGQLTEKVRRKPYSVILLDEIEKAHPDVFNVLLQILDDGRITDGQGVTVDFKNTIIIMTSNVAGLALMHMPAEMLDTGGDIPPVVMDELQGTFSPEFLNRLDKIVVFHKLTAEHMGQIIEILLGKVRQLLVPKKITLELTDAAKALVIARGSNEQFGARPLKRAIEQFISNPLADKLLEGIYGEGMVILVDAKNEDELIFTPKGADGQLVPTAPADQPKELDLVKA